MTRATVARVVSLSRASTRMHVGSRPRGGHVEGPPGPIVARVVRHVEGIDQDAR